MADAEGPQPSFVTVGLLTSTIVFTMVATVAVALRFHATSAIKDYRRRMLPEEYLILTALFFCYGIMIQTICAAAIGGVGTTKLSGINSAIFFIKIIWTDPFLIGPASGFVKLSILAFYCRIFDPIEKFKYACYVQMFLVVACSTGWVITQLFAANPIDGAWNPYHNYIVIDYSTFTLAIFGAFIALDFITLCLPLFVIRTLRMSAYRKWRVAGIFWLGAFCVIAAAVRFYYAYSDIHLAAAALSNQSRYAILTKTAIWSRIEPNASIIATCLPLYGPLVAKMRSVDTAIRSALEKVSLRSTSSNNSHYQTRAKSMAPPDQTSLEYSEGQIGMTIEHKTIVEQDRGRLHANRTPAGVTDPLWSAV